MKRGYYNALNIIKRDNHSCIDCKKEFSINLLVVHHIDENPLNNKTNNLVTLCRKCHHRRHGRLAPKREDIKEMREMGLTFQEIGEELGITKQRASFIFNRDKIAY